MILLFLEDILGEQREHMLSFCVEIDELANKKESLATIYEDKLTEQKKWQTLINEKKTEGESLKLKIEASQSLILNEKMGVATLEEKEKTLGESLAAFYLEQADMASLGERKNIQLSEIETSEKEAKVRLEENQLLKMDKEKEYESLILFIKEKDTCKDGLRIENMSLEKEIKNLNGDVKKRRSHTS